MKLRKIMSCVVSAALAFSSVAVCSISASAASNDALDFENGMVKGITMFIDDANADDSTLSVVDFNGSKMLKVDVKDPAKVPKVRFEVADLIGGDNLSKVATIELELIIETKDGTTAPGWIGGGVGTQGGSAGTPAWNDVQYSDGEYNEAVSQPIKITKAVNPSFVDGVLDTHLLVMRWACDIPYNMYIDNVKFLNSRDRAISITAEAEGAAPTEPATPEEPTTPAEPTEEPTTPDEPTEQPVEEPEETIESEEPYEEETEEPSNLSDDVNDYFDGSTLILVADDGSDAFLDASDIELTDIYGITFKCTFDDAEVADEEAWIGGGIGPNSNSTGWAYTEWGRVSKPIFIDFENGTIQWLSDEPIFQDDEEYAQLFIQTWGGTVSVDEINLLGADGEVIAGNEMTYDPVIPAETEESGADNTTSTTTTSTDSKGSPDTGVAGVAAAAGVAALAGVAVVVARKRK